ncbi:insoluble matrix shell protein 1-like [Mercenaria mercenaria]|uniref:insoluble matrix shell protein 1-like n=1 Tax=Mercenaria mercenaria TaxID=6596 RepID=UPI00234F5349|nr:insoluble matrix shell protein 1-like [Mercenaria mercenaria]
MVHVDFFNFKVCVHFPNAFQTPPQPYINLQARFPDRPSFRVRSCRIPRFDPENWNAPPTIRRNNCYNYATQRQTNSFAQPGRASGRGFSRPMTARSVLSATFRDGLIPLPFFNPRMFPGICYIALAIWPDTDYHFYRLDSNMLWSHKPGKTMAKNTDNSGDLIVDPRHADRGQYTIFAGYLGNHPGVRVI